MNYDHTNKIHDYWRKNIFPYLNHYLPTLSFDDYIKRFSFLPSGKWIHDLTNLKLHRVSFAIDPRKFLKKYKDFCVTYNCPIRPEDGFQRAIYQISPTLHLELAIWIWIEHEQIQAYSSIFICSGNKDEFLNFIDEIYSKMKMIGNTEDKALKSGFAQFLDPDNLPLDKS